VFVLVFVFAMARTDPLQFFLVHQSLRITIAQKMAAAAPITAATAMSSS
jgi:hypothetical protein